MAPRRAMTVLSLTFNKRELAPVPTVHPSINLKVSRRHVSMTKLAQRSPSIIAGAFVLPALMSGTADISATRRP